MTQTPSPTGRFRDLPIRPDILSVLEQKGFHTPTPIQHQCIPHAVEGKDIVGIAQTGTGKTLAFGIPLMQKLIGTNGLGLILVPTRELALQVDDVLHAVGKPLGLKTAVIIGGAGIEQQLYRLRQKPQIIVSTPGRLNDHLARKNLTLGRVSMVVLDEADRMLDQGFLGDIKKIFALTPSDRQTLLFSATMPTEIANIAANYMKIPLRIEVAPAGTASKNIEQEMYVVGKQDKMRLLDRILSDNKGTVLVFSRTKHGAKKITQDIRSMGHTVAEIHSNRSMSQRKTALQGFKSGQFRVLVATDIAARGIDVNNISLVINFDLPDNLEDYVHRIGRTGRASNVGKAISFATPDQRGDIRAIERIIKKSVPILALPQLPGHRPPTKEYVSRPMQPSKPARSSKPFEHKKPQGKHFAEKKEGQSDRPYRHKRRPFGHRRRRSS